MAVEKRKYDAAFKQETRGNGRIPKRDSVMMKLLITLETVQHGRAQRSPTRDSAVGGTCQTKKAAQVGRLHAHVFIQGCFLGGGSVVLPEG